MHKKTFFYFLIAFFFIQALVDLAHSVTVFPFIHYGMYSESFKRPESMEVSEVRVDGHLLRASDFSIAEWDRIHGPLDGLEWQTSSNDFSTDKEKIGQGFRKIGLGGLWASMRSRMSNDPGLSAAFPSWYKDRLTAIVRHPIQSLQVVRIFYRYQNGRLEPLRRENWIKL